MSVSNATEQMPARKRVRRLKPEVVAARRAARGDGRELTEELKKLYETPVEQLSPEDLAKMKAAFFLG
jgi:hypothetical protein